MKTITIAIDGHSSCGKSTMAKALARKIGYTYIDTGAMYRAITLFCMEQDLIENGVIDQARLDSVLSQASVTFGTDADGRQFTMLNGRNVEKEIRGMQVSSLVSTVSAIPSVRECMTGLQRRMGDGGGVIMDGRDIGTTVFPNAELKIFVTASDEVRARRRFDEMTAKGENPQFEAVLENVRQRDWQDSHRAISPLRKADDAILLDNSYMTIEEQDQWLMDKFHKATL